MTSSNKLEKTGIPNVFWLHTETTRYLVTKNLYPGHTVYGEKTYNISGEEYRVWDAYRSKLSGAIHKGISTVPIAEKDYILYLGAASGTTSSHVADIVGPKGKVFCIEFSARVARDLLSVSSVRTNMIPILADARSPEQYRFYVPEVDILYQDVAQPDQAKILVDNANYYLKKGGYAFLAIKARSIDVTKSPKEIFKEEVEYLKNKGFEIIDVVLLDPYDKDHAMVLVQKTV